MHIGVFGISHSGDFRKEVRYSLFFLFSSRCERYSLSLLSTISLTSLRYREKLVSSGSF
jgi:hypothetical protein